MSYLQVRDELDLYEHWRLLAVSYDAEEQEDYNLASLVAIGVNNPKQLRKWKWATADKGGTRSLNPGAATESIIGFASMMAGGNLAAVAGMSGGAKERAQATGRRLVYVAADGRAFTEDGQLTERTREDIAVPLPVEGLNDLPN